MSEISSNKIRILMVLGNTGRGGAQTFAMNVLRLIDKNRFQVDFVVNEIKNNGYTQEIYDCGSKIYKIPFFKVYNWLSYVKAWNNILSANHYDIVHGHVSSSASIYLKVARKFGCKTIAHSHSAGYRGNLFERIIKRFFTFGVKHNADYWFACSKPAARRLFGRNYEKYDHYYYIPNAIISDNYIFDASIRKRIRNQLGINDSQKLYGHVGSFTTPKNHSFLLDVFSEISKIDHSSVLVLAGEGEKKDEIKKRIEELRIENNVIMLGNVANVNEYMMAMDTMIFPSLFEGFPITVLEAQATGLPIVLSDTITDEVFLTDCVHPLSLKSGINVWKSKCLKLSNDNRTLENLAISSSKYNMRNCVQILMKIYDEMFSAC